MRLCLGFRMTANLLHGLAVLRGGCRFWGLMTENLLFGVVLWPTPVSTEREPSDG